jgi:hypothetical protein
VQRHDDVWDSGGIAPRILTLSTGRMSAVSFMTDTLIETEAGKVNVLVRLRESNGKV